MIQRCFRPASSSTRSRVTSTRRGRFNEVFGGEWSDGVEPVQWNFVRSAAAAMRGVYVHVVHDDVVIALEGRATLRLRDVREASPTDGMTAALDLSGATPTVAVVPHGVG